MSRFLWFSVYKACSGTELFGCAAARRSAPPLNVVGLPGYERLTDAEKQACTVRLQ